MLSILEELNVRYDLAHYRPPESLPGHIAARRASAVQATYLHAFHARSWLVLLAGHEVRLPPGMSRLPLVVLNVKSMGTYFGSFGPGTASAFLK